MNELKDVEGETVKFAIRSSHRLDTKTTKQPEMIRWLVELGFYCAYSLQQLGLKGKSTGDLNQFGDKLIKNYKQ